MKNKIVIFLLVALLSACGGQNTQTIKQPVDYVNNRIGNISILLVPTFPVTHLPNSMLRVIPTHTEFVTDRMTGLMLNNPSHRQGNALLLMPYSGDIKNFNSNHQYRYDHEKSTPYNYSVYFNDFDIEANFAPASKSAIYSFTFEADNDSYIMLRTIKNGELKFTNNAFTGYENYNGTKHYFYLEFDKTPTETATIEQNGKTILYARFNKANKTVKARYGISYISEQQAEKNLRNEITDYDMQALTLKARKAWNDVLGKINIEGGTEDEKVVFYTSLYRSHERPVNITEDGKYYSAYDKQVHDANGVDFWVDDWIWDTYLALHPLQVILHPKAEEEKLASFIRMYEHSGWVPTFPCVYGDAHCMNGNHAAGTFWDAHSKGLKVDLEKAFEGMKHTVLTETMIPWIRGPKTELDDFYHEKGWFPCLHPGEKETVPQVGPFEKRQGVAVTLAASYDDWCIAQMARTLGKTHDYNFFIKRSLNYQTLFNKETGFFHPKDKDGKFIEPFDYKLSGGIGSRDYYDENNGWTYIWGVYHNMADLVNLFGSKEKFANQLDNMFTQDMGMSKWTYYAVQPDATGSVGMYVMGNEPSFHIPYLYNYVGKPWETQKRIRMLLESWFRNDLMGICGDEDGGGMTAFYVFSAMGFYPVSPGIPMYNIGSPLFTKSTINLDNGKQFTVIANNASKDNKYIQSAKLNGKDHNQTWFSHTDLVNGGTLELIMGNRPNKNWGINSTPPSGEAMFK